MKILALPQGVRWVDGDPDLVVRLNIYEGKVLKETVTFYQPMPCSVDDIAAAINLKYEPDFLAIQLPNIVATDNEELPW